MKKTVMIAVLFFAVSLPAAAESVVLTGTLSSLTMDKEGKKLKAFVLKTDQGDFMINKRYNARLTVLDGKPVRVKAEVTKKEIWKLNSLKAVPQKKAKAPEKIRNGL